MTLDRSTFQMTPHSVSRPHLSKREREAMICEALHLSPGEAAQRYSISKDAIRRYRSMASQKLGASSRRDALIRFLEYYPEDVDTVRDIPFRAIADARSRDPFMTAVEGDDDELRDIAVDRERSAAGFPDRPALRMLIDDVLGGVRPGNLSNGLIGLLIIASAVVAGMIYFAVTGIASLLAAAATTLGVPLH